MNKPPLDRHALELYLRFSYPLSSAPFPGQEAAGYPEIRFASAPERGKEDYLSELNRILCDILEKERQFSDAAFLSSGVDSSLIAFGIRAKKTFSVAYEDEAFDESALALRSAERLGSEHHVVKISPADYFNAVDEAMACRSLPVGDASYIALFIAAREASLYTDVICSGEGPDEMFCGYPCYSRYFDDPREDFWLGVNTVMDIGAVPDLPSYGGNGFLKMNAFDLTEWLHGDILPNLPGAEKGSGITIRTPYLRHDLMDFALSLPVRYKADRTMGKLLFREAALPFVGREIAFREKRGFPVPVRNWMRMEPFKTRILDALTGTLARDILMCVDVEEILKTFYIAGDDSVWKQIWEMFTLIRWFEASYDGKAAYKNWRQSDPRFNREEAWPARLFPDADCRYFRDAGCLVCALAVMLRHYEVEKTEDERQFNPWILNQSLIRCGAFTSAADLDLSNIGRLYPLAYSGAMPYSEAALIQIAEKGQPCLITVPGNHAEHHFTTFLRLLPDDAVVYDPLCGERKLSTYDRICEIRVFQPSGTL